MLLINIILGHLVFLIDGLMIDQEKLQEYLDYFKLWDTFKVLQNNMIKIKGIWYTET